MRKVYSKPDIIFEDFSLSTSIAAGCETKTNTPSQDKCGFRFGAYMAFVAGVEACTMPVADGSINDGFCYHVPSAENNLFNS